MPVNALAPGNKVDWREVAESSRSALASMRRTASSIAKARPVSAAMTATATVGTFQFLKWLKANHPTRTNAFGIPLSAYLAIAGIGGGIFAMVSRHPTLERYADQLVGAGAGAACHVDEDIRAVLGGGGAAGCWDPAEDV